MGTSENKGRSPVAASQPMFNDLPKKFMNSAGDISTIEAPYDAEEILYYRLTLSQQE